MKSPKDYFNVQNSQNALQLNECLAKTYRTPDGQSQAGRTVLNHCQIVGSVAHELMVRMPQWLSDSLFPKGSQLVAAAHDIGKVSPTFQEKIYRGTSNYKHNSKPGLENINPSVEGQWGGHAGVSESTAKQENLNLGRFIPEILGQHHGYSPPVAGNMAEDEIFGGVAWQKRRLELVQQLKHLLNCDWPAKDTINERNALVLSGLTTVADWIGSGEFFEDPSKSWEPNIQQALDDAGFIRPQFKENLSFKTIFGFDAHDAQQKLFDSAIKPGVYILEAPMGMGKTEAALYAAYLAMSANNAVGFYFALPTQLTSNKIYTRVTAFLEKILTPDSPGRQQACLLHANAWLMGEDAQPGKSWFNANKRGILAPFAVGTIDQALMAVMNVKHGFVRTFGLMGKVVILDEVHSYDAYTGTILDELVNQLRNLHCTVIILSATLTKNRRSVFLSEQIVNSNHYPLISALPTDELLTEYPVNPIDDVKVKLCHVPEDDMAIEAALRCAEQGQQVLWIENTVAQAQEKFTLLASRAQAIGVETGLLHSRFIKVDREHNEQKWIKLYGKEGTSIRGICGRILVGTQVLEQSLDIDADFLVTRICPTDMLLQRIGRLWRHSETIRHAQATRSIYLLAPSLTEAVDNAKKAFGKTAKVYSPYVLCRSLAVWSSLTMVCIPSQVRDLLEETYQKQEENDQLTYYKTELEKERKKLERFALRSVSDGVKTLSEGKVSTRYSEEDSVEVLLLKSYLPHAQGTQITLLNNEQYNLPLNSKALDKKRWWQLSAILSKNTVRVAQYIAPEPVSQKQLKGLKDYFYLGNPTEEDSLLRIAIVGDDDSLVTLNQGAASPTYQLSYNKVLGYKANKSII